jgi:amino acid efflux transporter
MLSFVGWEAVAPLTTRFANPSKQLPRVIAIALAVTAALYLGLAIATISVLGSATTVPLADLLKVAIGPAGSIAAAAAAVVLTVGAVNAYVNGALVMARQLTRPEAAEADADRGVRAPALLLAIALAGLVLITLYGFRLVSTAALVTLPTTLFLTVYLGSMLAATRVLRGATRLAACAASVAVFAMLPYCGWALLAPAAVALVIWWRSRRSRRLTGALGVPASQPPSSAPSAPSGPGSRSTSADCTGTRLSRHPSRCSQWPPDSRRHRRHGEASQPHLRCRRSQRPHPRELLCLSQERSGH